MVQLSAVIITYNEEQNIARCLKSLEGVADEIVVIDSFSTDNTEAICKSFGVRFIQHPFEGHIQQKNYAVDCAHFEHVLSLDADEELSPRLKDSILSVKANWEADGYYFNRLTNFCGDWIKHSGWYPDRKLRLWIKPKGRWGGLNPHDRVIMVADASQKFLKGDLNHYSYSSHPEFEQRTWKYSEIGAKSLLLQNKNVGCVKLFYAPISRFIKHYIVGLGFLDGANGFYISWVMAKGVYIKYSELRKLNRSKK
jgi:glycosyltransferase involved in cell wall biosynthesis